MHDPSGGGAPGKSGNVGRCTEGAVAGAAESVHRAGIPGRGVWARGRRGGSRLCPEGGPRTETRFRPWGLAHSCPAAQAPQHHCHREKTPRKQRAAPGRRNHMAPSPARPSGQACGTGGGLPSSAQGNQPGPPVAVAYGALTCVLSPCAGWGKGRDSRGVGWKVPETPLEHLLCTGRSGSRVPGLTGDLPAGPGGPWEPRVQNLGSAAGTGPADLGAPRLPSSPAPQV